jgi:hypothetical protein
VIFDIAFEASNARGCRVGIARKEQAQDRVPWSDNRRIQSRIKLHPPRDITSLL